MGYRSKVQVIQRANNTRQYYLILPAPLAEALEFQKGETIEWVVENKKRLLIKRAAIR
jgi:antitoxin component of MazEF toxin-antitoxin module